MVYVDMELRHTSKISLVKAMMLYFNLHVWKLWEAF